eukprot:27685-Pyramimonas_sp.AAC.1
MHDAAVMGLPAARVKQERAAATTTAGFTVGGKCTSTIMLRIYGKQDPRSFNLRRQITEWFTFWAQQPQLHARVRLGWQAAVDKMARVRAKSKWRSVTGPMGALI